MQNLVDTKYKKNSGAAGVAAPGRVKLEPKQTNVTDLLIAAKQHNDWSSEAESVRSRHYMDINCSQCVTVDRAALDDQLCRTVDEVESLIGQKFFVTIRGSLSAVFCNKTIVFTSDQVSRHRKVLLGCVTNCIA